MSSKVSGYAAAKGTAIHIVMEHIDFKEALSHIEILLSGVAGLHNLNNSLGFNDWAKSYQYRDDYSTSDYVGHTGQICKTPGIQNGGLYIRSERPSGQQDDEAFDTQFLASYVFSHSVNLTNNLVYQF